MRTVMSWPAMTPIISRVPVPELPKSSGAVGLAQAADAAAEHLAMSSPTFSIGAPSACSALRRVEHVLGLEQAGDAV